MNAMNPHLPELIQINFCSVNRPLTSSQKSMQLFFKVSLCHFVISLSNWREGLALTNMFNTATYFTSMPRTYNPVNLVFMLKCLGITCFTFLLIAWLNEICNITCWTFLKQNILTLTHSIRAFLLLLSISIYTLKT